MSDFLVEFVGGPRGMTCSHEGDKDSSIRIPNSPNMSGYSFFLAEILHDFTIAVGHPYIAGESMGSMFHPNS